MAVRFTKVIQRADVGPLDSGATDFNLSEPVPAGLVEMVGLRMKYTGAGATHAANEWGLLKNLTIIYNGNQVYNYTDLAANAALTTVPRQVALVEDLGGYIQSSGSSTAVDSWMWIPLGLNLGGNSRIEVRLNFVSAGAVVSGREFEIWQKFGSSNAATIVGNATTASMSAGSQTQVTVKIPSYPNATVTAIQLQSTTAGDDVSGVIVKPITDFEFTADALRANAGRGFGKGELYDYLDGATLVQTDGSGSGQVLLPCYGYSSADNSIVLLVTATTGENYSFTPILSVPTSGNGERMGVQTASKSTSGAEAILDRAE